MSGKFFLPVRHVVCYLGEIMFYSFVTIIQFFIQVLECMISEELQVRREPLICATITSVVSL